jgi:hypothetical protein
MNLWFGVPALAGPDRLRRDTKQVAPHSKVHGPKARSRRLSRNEPGYFSTQTHSTVQLKVRI